MKTILILFSLCMPVFAQAAHYVDLNCNAPVGGGSVTGYNAKRSTVSGSGYVTIASAATCSFKDTSAEVQVEGKKFYYVFTATGPGGESPNSNEAAATIPFSVPPAPTGATAVPH